MQKTGKTKRCLTCNTYQSPSNFHRSIGPRSPTGLRGSCKTCTNHAQRLGKRRIRLEAKGIHPDDPIRLYENEAGVKNAIDSLLKRACRAMAIQVRGAVLPWPDALYLKAGEGPIEILVCKTPKGRIEFSLSEWTTPRIAEALLARGIEVPLPGCE